ncbi:hypothetical protein BDD12DRAFT_825702 [Trichophaea hybrida]|nr:hypothetical protein BDD12DRAFT_825702 [Trichophaea hybrida]
MDFRINVGTEWYKALEIYIGSQETYITHVDLWSLGCVLYWTRVGRMPLTNAYIPQLIQYLLSQLCHAFPGSRYTLNSHNRRTSPNETRRPFYS